MFKVTNEAVELTSQALVNSKRNLTELFEAVKKENPKVAEYIKAQASKSRGSAKEIYSTGVVTYLLMKHQWEIDHLKATNQSDADPKDKDLEKFQNFLDNVTPGDLGKIPEGPF